MNAPKWTKWEDKQIDTSIGDMRQWSNETAISYSIPNNSDQLEIRDYRLSITRLEPGSRADGVVVFDRPNFKESTEKLFLQIAQADQVDRPILIRLPFTPPISSGSK